MGRNGFRPFQWFGWNHRASECPQMVSEGDEIETGTCVTPKSRPHTQRVLLYCLRNHHRTGKGHLGLWTHPGSQKIAARLLWLLLPWWPNEWGTLSWHPASSCRLGVSAQRWGRKCSTDSSRMFDVAAKWPPAREALEGSPALPGSGPSFHVWDSEISSRRWFVEAVYKQMISPVNLPPHTSDVCWNSKPWDLVGSGWEGRTVWLRTDTLQSYSEGEGSTWSRKLRPELWERKVVTHGETLESK